MLYRMTQPATAMKFAYPLALLLLVHIVLTVIDGYAVAHVDSVMHLLGGVALAILFAGLLSRAVRAGRCPDPGRVLSLLLVTGLVVCGAVAWEVYEYLSDVFLGTRHQLSLGDTMKDLVLGGLSGLLLATRLYLRPAVRRPVPGAATESGSG